jgi:hypothetical protein
MVLTAATLCLWQSARAQSNDPPARIGRVSDVTGSVSLLPVGETTWSSASLNYPLTTGDAIWADADGRAEVHVGSSAVRIAAGTSLVFDAIEDNLIQLRIGQGAVQVRLHELGQGDSYEIDTPAGAILLHAAGAYRVDVTPDGRRTTVTVRTGAADVTIGNDTYPVRHGTSVTLTGGGAPPVADRGAMAPDVWENWADARDRREDAVPATRYVSREMVGYEDLDEYGDWQADATYGPVWYPRSVGSDWAPYRTGRWESVQPWGWTWIDEEPWGFAPFHYGRWSHQRGRWGWIPGRESARPVYAPALVAFVSGDGWSASLSMGAGGGVGWVPLGPNEMYVPAYRASPAYARSVNVANVNGMRADATRPDVNTVHYANRNVPGAVTAVPRDVFMGSRSVRGANVPVRPADLATIRVSARPIAAGVAIVPPPRGSPMDRARPDHVGAIRQPPVALPRSPMTPRRPGAAAGTPKPGTPPGQQDRGRPNAYQAPVTPPPAAPTTPSNQAPGQGRGRDQQTPTPIRPVPMPAATTPAVPPPTPRGGGRSTPGKPAARVPAAPAPAAPTLPLGRGRDQQTPTPIRPVPMPAAPTTPAARDHRQPTQPAPRPIAPRPATPTPAVPPTPTPRGGGRGTPATPAARVPAAPAPAPPTTPQARGRGTPAQPSTPPGHSGNPTKPRPDSARSGHGPSGGLEY